MIGSCKIRGRAGLWAAIIACLLVAAPAAQAREQAAQAVPDAYRIVAVGDSVTAGYQPGMTDASVPYGYVDRLYEQALYRGRAESVNYGILALGTEGLQRLLQGAREGRPLTASDLLIDPDIDPRVTAHANAVASRTDALRDDLAAADLVVLTIGANDFIGLFRKLLTMTETEAKQSLQQSIGSIMNNYSIRLEQSLRLLHGLTPDAAVLVADQYLPMPRLAAPGMYDFLQQSVVAPLAEAADGVTRTLRDEGADVRLVSVGAAFQGHELAWTHISKADNHPTDAGYEAIAKQFAAAVWDDYRKPETRTADVPLAIVVGGSELHPAFQPVVAKGTTFVALTDLSRALGAKLQWVQKTQTAIFRKGGTEVAVTIGASAMQVNGKSERLPAPAQLRSIDGAPKTYVPLAAIARALDYQVEYRAKLRTAFLNP